MKPHIGITTKLLVSVLAPVMVSIVVMFLVFVFNLWTLFDSTSRNRAEIIAQTLDSGIGSEKDLLDFPKLQDQIYKLMLLNPAISKIEVSLPNEKEELVVQVSSEQSRVGMVGDLDNKKAFVEGNLVSKKAGDLLNFKEEIVTVSPIRVSGRVVGAYEIGLSSEEKYQLFFRQIVTLGSGALAMILVLIGIVYLTAKKQFINPLLKLVQGAEEIGAGKFGYRVEVNTGDEMGELAASLNSAAEKLDITYKDLEAKVKMRTEELNSKLDTINTQKSNLEDNKKAMLNVLEDEKELENQLKLEKEGVEQKVNERTVELSVERNRLRAVLDNLVRGILVVGKNRETVIFNKKIFQLLGNLEKIDYKILSSFFGDLDLDEMLEKAEKTKQMVAREKVLVGIKYFDLFVVPVVTENGIDNIAIFVEDVTERVSMERSRDEFFSIASHELRTPLTAIRGNTEMILDNYKDKIKDKEVIEMLSDVHEGSVRLIEIVNDFLNVSRLEMGKIEFKIEKTNLIEIIKETIEEFKSSNIKPDLEVKISYDKSDLEVLVDKDRIKQVLINLLGNAFKFTDKGGVYFEGFKVTDGSVEVDVRDTGAGIADEQQSLLFKKFQQAGSSIYTRDTSKGTGLGLYISGLLVNGMNGKIWLKSSKANKGSVFAFSVPIAK